MLKPFAIIFALIAVILSPGQDAAAAIPLGERACIVGTNADVDLAAFLKLNTRPDCGPDRFSSRMKRMWGVIDLEDMDIPPGPLVLSLDSVAFENVEVHAVYEGDIVRSARYGSDIATTSWTPASRYFLDVPSHDGVSANSSPERLIIAIDRPFSGVALSVTTLLGKTEAEARHRNRIMLFALLAGMVLLPIIYNMAFFVVLQQKFLIWHALMLLGAGTYIVSSAGFLYAMFPGLSLMVGWNTGVWSFSLGVGAAAIFARDFLEPGMVDRTMHRLLTLCPVVLFLTTAVVQIGGESVRMAFRPFYFLSFLPWLILFVVVIAVALKRKSRAARFLAASWAAIIITGMERVLRGAGFIEGTGDADVMLYGALAIESLVTALGVADRFLIMRRQGDRAAEHNVRLAQLADTDGLTGIANRRAFDNDCQKSPPGALAILDIDEFKAINDQFGHVVGDDVLRTVAEELDRLVGPCGQVYRIGGEEFAVTLERGNAEDVWDMADRIRDRIGNHVTNEVPAFKGTLTLSAGVALVVSETDISDAYARADAAMYKAKRAGRDRTVMAGDHPKLVVA